MTDIYDIVYSIIKQLNFDSTLLELRKFNKMYKNVVDEYINIEYNKLLDGMANNGYKNRINHANNIIEKYNIIFHEKYYNDYLYLIHKYNDNYMIENNIGHNNQVLYVYCFNIINYLYIYNDKENINQLRNCNLTDIKNTYKDDEEDDEDEEEDENYVHMKTLYYNCNNDMDKKPLLYYQSAEFLNNRILIHININYFKFNNYNNIYNHNNHYINVIIEPFSNNLYKVNYKYEIGNYLNTLYDDYKTDFLFSSDKQYIENHEYYDDMGIYNNPKLINITTKLINDLNFNFT